MSVSLNRLALFFGVSMLVIGVMLQAGLTGWLPGWLDWIGHLPGDLVIHGVGFRVVVPFGSAALVSLGLTLVLELWDKLR